jgi:hypothetical protein
MIQFTPQENNPGFSGANHHLKQHSHHGSNLGLSMPSNFHDDDGEDSRNLPPILKNQGNYVTSKRNVVNHPASLNSINHPNHPGNSGAGVQSASQ